MNPVKAPTGSDYPEQAAAIDAAFARHDNDRGLELLRELAAQCADDAQLQYRLAVVEEQIGLPENASRAYLHCLELAPRNELACLYAGYWFQQQGEPDRALALFLRGAELNETVLAWSADPGQPHQTRLRSQAANIALRHHYSELHRSAAAAEAGCERIERAIWTRTHDEQFEFANPRQRPELFYIRDLRAAPVMANECFSWAGMLEAQSDLIIEEFSAALPGLVSEARPYLENNRTLSEAFPELAGSLNWSSLDLYRDGVPCESIVQHFPGTLDVLRQIPLYSLDEHPFEVFFSTLGRGQHITPHYGLSNHSLTVHLPLIVPENCWLRVAEEKICWQPGRLVVFDDTFDHEAMNHSDSDRVVLIFSVWHPDLSAAERAAVQRCFRTRLEWRENRTS